MNLAAFKKYPVLSLSLLAAVLLAGAGAGLVRSLRQYSRQIAELEGMTARFARLDRRVPYPSEDNVAREGERLKDLIDRYNELNEALRAEQIEPQAMEAADFLQFLEKTLRELRTQFQSSRIGFPERYAFGFDRYAGGQLPAPADIPRLVQQLKLVERICGDLRAAGITELVAIEREAIEELNPQAEESAGRGGRGGVPPVEGAPPEPEWIGGLFSISPFTVRFQAKEPAVMALLNRLASQPMFVRVTSLELVNPRQDFNLSAAGAPSAPAAAGDAAAAQERAIMLGREELTVAIKLDLFRFAPSLSFDDRPGG